MKRHSGVELIPCVLKRGMGPNNGGRQADLIEETPSVSIPLLMRYDDGDYVMARGSDVGPAHFPAIYKAFERLWAHDPTCIRDGTAYEDYHAYIESRAKPHMHQPVVAEAHRRLRACMFNDGQMPKDFTHGDATLQNCLLYEGRIVLIDHSPRPTPTDRIVDQSKLLLSAAGMDNDGSGLRTFHYLFKDGWQIFGTKPAILNTRLQYHVLAHIIRVASREPTYDEFFAVALKEFFP